MEKRRLSYIYSFKCEDDIEIFKNLPDETRRKIEIYIVKVISESFVVPGDEDYITARLLAQKGLHRAFFWAASQALEKYLKAFLLMRGISVIEDRFKGHPVVALFDEATAIDSQLAAIETKPHSDIKIHSNAADCFKEIPVEKLLADIEAQGSPDSRYNSFGVNFSSGHLFALDSFVFGLRRHIGVPSIQKTLRKINQELIDSFNSYNPWFATSQVSLEILPNNDFKLNLSGGVTTLEMLISDHSPFCSNFALQWLDKKMKLPSKVKQHLRGK